VVLFALPLHAEPPQGLAVLYGETLGAAQGCPGVAPDRLTATVDRAAKHLKEVAGTDSEADAAAKDFAVGMSRGRRDIVDGVLTCAQAESEFSNLERDLAP
jgi:hypothetical protein